MIAPYVNSKHEQSRDFPFTFRDEENCMRDLRDELFFLPPVGVLIRNIIDLYSLNKLCANWGGNDIHNREDLFTSLIDRCQ